MAVEASHPSVSVVVATHQRARLLPRLVAALERQTLPADAFEVVVCDDGSTDGTGEVLRRLAASSRMPMRVVSSERSRGPAVARNLAWRGARAPVIAFTDDDTQPTPPWLAAGLAALAGSADRMVVGRVVPHPDQLELAGRPFTRTVRVEDPWWFATCNVFYWREHLEAVNGFDEGFEHPGGEDTDLGLRVCDLGVSPIFSPDALVYHDVRASSYLATFRETLRWTGIPRLAKRHPAHRRRYLHSALFWKATHPRALLALAGLLVGWRRPAGLILCLPWVRYRTRWAPLCEGPRRRWLVLPAGLSIDLLEVAVMARASLHQRTLVL